MDLCLVHHEQLFMAVVQAVVMPTIASAIASTTGISHISNLCNVNSTFAFAQFLNIIYTF